MLWHERNLAESTRTDYRLDFEALERRLEKPLLHCTEEDLIQYFSHRQKLGHAVTSITRSISALRGFYADATELGLLKESQNPMARIQNPSLPRRLPHSLSESETKALIEAADPASGLLVYRDRVMLEVLYATGLRVSELIGLRVD